MSHLSEVSLQSRITLATSLEVLQRGAAMSFTSLQELRSWEEALARAAEEQREQEEQLRRREQELAEREIDIVERELNIIIHQMYQEKPSVKKRKGHFKKSRLLKLGKDSNCISLPSGGWKRELQSDAFKEMNGVHCTELSGFLVKCFFFPLQALNIRSQCRRHPASTRGRPRGVRAPHRPQARGSYPD